MEIPEAKSEQASIRNCIDGGWKILGSDDGVDLINSATDEEIGHVPFATPKEANNTITTLQAAFEDWIIRPVEERIQPLFRLKQLLEEHQEELTCILAQEHEKAFYEAQGKIRREIENVYYIQIRLFTLRGGQIPDDI